jgi:MoaA/NifB/PqqE/SkfB family radical SAM enzyme
MSWPALRRLPRYAVAAARVGRANFARLDAPLKLNFAVTYWCQYRCRTCNIWRKKPQDELSTGEILAFVARNRGFSWVDVTGGEIFLRDDIEEILAAMATDWRRLLILHFPTNGYQTDKIVRVTERVAARSRAALVVTVSVDGNEELNDRLRGVAGGFRHQLETFRALRRIPGVRAVLGMTLSRDNLGAFDATYEACRRACPELTIEDFHLNVMQLSGHYYSNEDRGGELPDVAAAACDLRAYRLRRGAPRGPGAWLEDQYLRNIERYLGSGRTPMRCHALRSSCFIDPWGTVYPCITWARPVGSLREHGMELGSIWESGAARGAQADAWRGACPQCWTACEAYPSILGNLLRPDHRRVPDVAPVAAGAIERAS